MIEVEVINTKQSNGKSNVAWDWKCDNCTQRLHFQSKYARIITKVTMNDIFLCEACFGPFCDTIRFAIDPKLEIFR